MADARCVATIANRDPEQMEQLKAMFAKFGASIVELPADGSLRAADLARRRIDLVLLKLTSGPENRNVFRALRNADVGYLNSLLSVKLCQSRRATFTFVSRRLPEIATPRMFNAPSQARRALADGQSVWVRRDAHNIPLNERVLGVAHTAGEFDELIGGHEPRSLFFQEYLGRAEHTYKAYVVGTTIDVLRRTELQEGPVPEQSAAVAPATIGPEVRNALLSVGRAFGMSVYGLDLFYRGGRPVLLDVNDFPSFRGIAEASRKIRDFAAAMHFRQGP